MCVTLRVVFKSAHLAVNVCIQIKGTLNLVKRKKKGKKKMIDP